MNYSKSNIKQIYFTSILFSRLQRRNMERSSSVIIIQSPRQCGSVKEPVWFKSQVLFVWAYELCIFHSRKSISGFIHPPQKGMSLLTREAYNSEWKGQSRSSLLKKSKQTNNKKQNKTKKQMTTHSTYLFTNNESKQHRPHVYTTHYN